jgi:hypothetical protein
MTQSEIIDQKNALYSERNTLESQLSSDDYKTIKNVEAQTAGKSLPYDPKKLHAKHQAWRDRINAINDEIAALECLEPDEDAPQDDDSTGSSQGGNANQGGSGDDFGG